MGTKETVLVCPILREQRGEALTVICLNGSGEGGQQTKPVAKITGKSGQLSFIWELYR
jgi:hypothetical protein